MVAISVKRNPVDCWLFPQINPGFRMNRARDVTEHDAESIISFRSHSFYCLRVSRNSCDCGNDRQSRLRNRRTHSDWGLADSDGILGERRGGNRRVRERHHAAVGCADAEILDRTPVWCAEQSLVFTDPSVDRLGSVFGPSGNGQSVGKCFVLGKSCFRRFPNGYRIHARNIGLHWKCLRLSDGNCGSRLG